MATTTLSWKEWGELDATAIATLIHKGELSPKEAAQQCAAARAKLNPELNCVLEIFDDVVDNPNKDGMNSEGVFHGVPMLMKDAVSGMQGRHQEWGASFMKGIEKPADDPLTNNLRQGGFNLMGRTSLPPMGAAATSESMLHGVTRNPWNPERTPSGSSGGSAAAVSSGIVPIATASDGGGSTRSPANYTGLIGLKPSRGRLPMATGFNEYSIHFGVEGVLTRTVRDTAAAFDIMAKHNLGGRFMPIPDPAEPYTQSIQKQPGQLRIALSLGQCGREGKVDDEVANAVRQTAKRLEALGHIVEEYDDAQLCDWATLWNASNAVWIGSCQFWPELAELVGSSINEDTLEAVYRHLITASSAWDAHGFHHAAGANPVFTRQFGQFFEQYDLWLTPTETEIAPLCGPESDMSPLYPCDSPEEAVAFMERMTDNARFMVPANECGYPAISVPAATDSNGVPIGAQLSAAWCREDLLLQVAAQLEQAHPEIFNQQPTLHVSKL